ncbi:MAG: hypothetical protein H0W28_12870 [Pyrinomonadaceae bacterium]|nr:hypothetical protein [Pyrinomonadaceae bacterium]
MAVREWNEQILSLLKIVSGGAFKYGIQVARLAGLPREILGTRQKKILAHLKKANGAVAETSARSRRQKASTPHILCRAPAE